MSHVFISFLLLARKKRHFACTQQASNITRSFVFVFAASACSFELKNRRRGFCWAYIVHFGGIGWRSHFNTEWMKTASCHHVDWMEWNRKPSSCWQLNRKALYCYAAFLHYPDPDTISIHMLIVTINLQSIDVMIMHFVSHPWHPIQSAIHFLISKPNQTNIYIHCRCKHRSRLSESPFVAYTMQYTADDIRLREISCILFHVMVHTAAFTPIKMTKFAKTNFTLKFIIFRFDQINGCTKPLFFLSPTGHRICFVCCLCERQENSWLS